MSRAIKELRNDRDTIIGVVSEHYIMDRKEIKELQIKISPNHVCSTPKNIIEHGLWRFCYHRDMAVVYIL